MGVAELVVVATPCCPLSAPPVGVKGLTGRETMLPSVERNLLTFDLASASPSSSSSAYKHKITISKILLNLLKCIVS